MQVYIHVSDSSSKQQCAAYHDTHEPSTHDQDTQHRNNPMDPILCRPAVKKEAERHCQPAWDGHDWLQTVFRLVLQPLRLGPLDNQVCQLPKANHAYDHADAGGKKG